MKITKFGYDRQLFFHAMILFMIEFVRGAFIFSYLPTLPVISADVLVSIVGLAVTLHFISDSAVNIVAGFLMKSIGERRIIHISFMFSIAGLVIVPVFGGSWTLLAGAVLLGIGICPFWLLMLTKASGEERGKNMGLIYLCWLTGLGSGLVFMNYILQFEYSLTFWILPGVMLVGWLLYANTSGAQISVNPPGLKEQWQQTLKLLKGSLVVLPGILLQGVAMGMLIPILPTFILKDLHLSSDQYSLLMVIGGGICIMLLVPMGKLADRFNKKVSIFFSLIFLGASLFLLTKGNNIFLIIGCVALIGFFYAMLLPAWNSYISEYIPPAIKETSWGLFSGIQGIGVMLGPILGSLLAQQAHTGVTIEFSAGILAGCACFYLLLWGWNRKSQKSY
jgi:MFS family permease